MTEVNSIKFTMGYYVLKTLGKGLYSNPWAAISELVANGFDANARSIKVIFNLKENRLYDIYVIDDGCGMNEFELKNYYANIGHNKRMEDERYLGSNRVMGRKGIGKLAALYLSDHYNIFTKKENDTQLKYSVDFTSLKGLDSASMILEMLLDSPIIADYTKNLKSFTAIHIIDAKLDKYGDRAFESLSIKLGNYFSFETAEMKEKSIRLIKLLNGELEVDENIEKVVAFNNMLILSKIGKYEINYDLKDEKISIFSKRLGKRLPQVRLVLNDSSEKNKGTINSHGYVLSGWLGLHATINIDEAKLNDSRFTKNKFYNPIQIRVYSRNKLAVENFQNYLLNTQTYSNYIEGDLHFDVLDENDLDDIATANRQDLDINDVRVQKLIELVGEKITVLIKMRNEINLETSKIEETEIGFVNSSAKNEFANEFEQSMINLNIDEHSKKELKTIVVSNLKGEIVKNSYSLFFSHSSKTKIYSDLIWGLLLRLGAKKEEIFYTSATMPGLTCRQVASALNEQIKSNIIDTNSLVVFFNTPTFNTSEFCLFEGGAGWATKSKQLIHILADKHSSIPEYLRNHDTIITEISGILDRKNYETLISSINVMVEHLNKGRRIHQDDLISELIVTDIPDDVTIQRNGKKLSDYFDSTFLEYWNFYKDELFKITTKQNLVRDLRSEFESKLSDIYKS